MLVSAGCQVDGKGQPAIRNREFRRRILGITLASTALRTMVAFPLQALQQEIFASACLDYIRAMNKVVDWTKGG